MGSLIKQFSVASLVSQLIWALLLFSSFSVKHVLTGFGELGPFILGALALTAAIGWFMMVAFLFTNEEIENKTLWFLALLFLPGQFIFWIQFIQESEALDALNEPTFDRAAFKEEYNVAPIREDVMPVSTPAKRRRGLTPPAFMALSRKPANEPQPRL